MLRFWLFVGIGFVVWRSCVRVCYCIWRRFHASFLMNVIRLRRLELCGRLVCWAADCRRCKLAVLLERFFGWRCIRGDCDVCSQCATARYRAWSRFVVNGHVVNFMFAVCLWYVNLCCDVRPNALSPPSIAFTRHPNSLAQFAWRRVTTRVIDPRFPCVTSHDCTRAGHARN